MQTILENSTNAQRYLMLIILIAIHAVFIVFHLIYKEEVAPKWRHWRKIVRIGVYVILWAILMTMAAIIINQK